MTNPTVKIAIAIAPVIVTLPNYIDSLQLKPLIANLADEFKLSSIEGRHSLLDSCDCYVSLIEVLKALAGVDKTDLDLPDNSYLKFKDIYQLESYLLVIKGTLRKLVELLKANKKNVILHTLFINSLEVEPTIVECSKNYTEEKYKTIYLKLAMNVLGMRSFKSPNYSRYV